MKITSTNKTLNRKFFDNWTRESAYIFGFTYADGYFCPSANRIGWSLNPRDEHILHQFKKHFKSGIPIRRYAYGKKKCSRLEIHCNEFVKAFKKQTSLKNKTYRLSFPTGMPKIFLPDFIRGYFDGDGSVTYSTNKAGRCLIVTFTSCSKSFLVQLKKSIEDSISIKIPNVMRRTKRAFGLRMNGWKSQRFGRWIYTKSKLFLHRKKEVWKRADAYEFLPHLEAIKRYYNK